MSNSSELFGNFFDDYFNTYKKTTKYKDECRLELLFRKNEYEEHLDDMWGIYLNNPAQIVEYNKQIESIKETGCKVLRNSAGKHKIVTDC